MLSALQFCGVELEQPRSNSFEPPCQSCDFRDSTTLAYLTSSGYWKINILFFISILRKTCRLILWSILFVSQTFLRHSIKNLTENVIPNDQTQIDQLQKVVPILITFLFRSDPDNFYFSLLCFFDYVSDRQYYSIFN